MLKNTLPNLKLLNLSNNKLRTLGIIDAPGLTEIYAMSNLLKSVNELSYMFHLQVIDVSENGIERFEDFSCLSMLALTGLRLIGNPVFSHKSYEYYIRKVVDEICVKDFRDPLTVTNFGDCANYAFEQSENHDLNK